MKHVNYTPHLARMLLPEAEYQLCLPAHLKEEAISPGHPLQLMFVLLQQVDITFLWDKLQKLERQQESKNSHKRLLAAF